MIREGRERKFEKNPRKTKKGEKREESSLLLIGTERLGVLVLLFAGVWF